MTKKLTKTKKLTRAELIELYGMEVPTRLPSWMIPFLEAYPTEGSIVATCQFLQLAPTARINVHWWLHRKDDDGPKVVFFKRAFVIAKALAIDSIRAAIKARGIDGYEEIDEEYEWEPVWGTEDDGRVEFAPVIKKRKVKKRTSDSMLALLARINDPEARATSVDVTSKGEPLSNLIVFVPKRDED